MNIRSSKEISPKIGMEVMFNDYKKKIISINGDYFPMHQSNSSYPIGFNNGTRTSLTHWNEGYYTIINYPKTRKTRFSILK